MLWLLRLTMAHRAHRETRPVELSEMLKTNVGFRFLLVHAQREFSEENILAWKVRSDMGLPCD